MINIGKFADSRFLDCLRRATQERIRTGPAIAAQAMALRPRTAARGSGMSLTEAQRQLANIRARRERNERDRQEELRADAYESLPPVTPAVHDIASIFVQAQFAPINREERLNRRLEVADAMRFHHARGSTFVFIR